MTKNEIRNKIIANGVKNLREFGYPNCNKENILTDLVYGSFFMNSLEDNKGHSKEIDTILDELFFEIKKNINA